MGYLLDTNVLIYILSAPTELSSDAKRGETFRKYRISLGDWH
jgi:predicted nucleic acid-binding protein